MVTRFLSLLQEVRELQVTAQPSRSKHYWQARPFRVRSPQTGVQVGLVAASLAELQMEAADALEIHHPWSLRLLLVEPDADALPFAAVRALQVRRLLPARLGASAGSAASRCSCLCLRAS